MADSAFPYTPVPNSLKRLLEQIPTIGTPDKADQKWLASLGFGGGNNQMSLGVLRKIGVIGRQGEPTDLWKALRSKDRVKWADGIRKAYPDLFSTYPDAQRKDDEALVAFVRSKTDYGERAQQYAVRTFKVLAEFGDFEQAAAKKTIEETDTHEDDTPADGTPVDQGRSVRRRTPAGTNGDGRVALTVNLQLQLPPSADGEVYDKLFAAMAKHLKGLVTIE